MDISTEVTPTGVAVVRPAGAIDATTAAVLREHLHSLVHAGRVRLVVDLSAVDVVDSTGIGVLISGLKAARKNGGDLRVAKPNEWVTKMFELTSLSWVLKSFDSPESAFGE